MLNIVMNPQRIHNYSGAFPQPAAMIMAASNRNLSATICAGIRKYGLSRFSNFMALVNRIASLNPILFYDIRPYAVVVFQRTVRSMENLK